MPEEGRPGKVMELPSCLPTALPDGGRRSGAPLRRRLLLLTGMGIVPLALISGIGLYLLVHEQRLQAERVGSELVRAVATAVDAELRSTIAVLEALATSLALDADDRDGFWAQALRILNTRSHWAAVMLTDTSATRIVDTRYSPSHPLPAVIDRNSLERAVHTRAPVVGTLTRDPGGNLVFPVRVPVMRRGEVRYVVTAVVDPDAIRSILGRQRLPDDWVISIFDASGRRVARSRAHAENLGGEGAPSLLRLMEGGAREGVGETYTLEGDRVYTMYSRLDSPGWSVALGIPAPLVEAAWYRSLAAYGGGILVSIVLGAVAAVWVARSITRPIADLRVAAQALGLRQPVVAPDTDIHELRDVAGALVAAAEERTRAEADREALLRLEQEARVAAEAADRAKDQFLAVLSHELRTPLNAVYGWARMLRSGQVDAAQQARALEAIERNASAQVQLVDDLLDVSRVITGKMRLDVRPVNLTAVVEAALDAVRPAAAAKRIGLERVLDPHAGPITGDPDRLQQVVWNLLINAVKFTPAGGSVQLHVRRMRAEVEIVVSDTGQGIARDVLPLIFERFRQGDSSTTRAHSGLGLGLALVRHLVELHGGRVTARSAGEGTGATFVVTLPIIAEVPAGPAPGALPTVSSSEPAAAAARLDGVRVLVVDDDADALDLATAILASAGATVRTADSAPTALDAVRQWRPDVLVSDIEMPGEDGYSLIRRVRELAPMEGGKIPAVALTAYGRVQDRVLCLAAGYSMHVPKPVAPGELTTIVASLAGRAPDRPPWG